MMPDSSETWTSDGFEQSSDDVWSSSTGVIIRPHAHESNLLRVGVELASGIEEVVSTITQKQLGPSFPDSPERQAWESVAALAKGKLKNLEKKTQDWLSKTVTRKVSNPHTATVSPQNGLSISNASSRGPEQASSRGSSAVQEERPHVASFEPSFELQNGSLLPSESLLPDLSFPTTLSTDYSNQALLPMNWLDGDLELDQEGSEDFIRLDSEPQGSAQILNQSLQPMGSASSNLLLELLDQAENTVSTPSNFLSAPNPLDVNAPAIRRHPGGVRKPRKAASSSLSQSLTANRLHQREIFRDYPALLALQEQPTLEIGDDSQPINLRRGRPSERGVSCVYCTLRKKKCVGDVPCDACLKSKLYRTLCVPANFKESRSIPHRLYYTRIGTLLNNIAEWTPVSAFSQPISIKISNGFKAYFEVELQAYIPHDYEALTHVLFRGLEGGMIPPRARSTAFALRGDSLSSEKIDQYCDSLCRDLVFNEAREQYTLANYVLMFAANQCQVPEEQNKLPGLEMVELALRFWAMQAIFFKSQWTIVEGASLVGMSPIENPGFWHGVTLLPRLVNQELDRAFEKRMDELEKDILERLQRAVFKDHRELWCSIFLTCFIVLHSLEKDSWNMCAWECETQRPGGTVWPLRETPCDYYNQNQHIADIVASHFRVVNKGHTPFAIDWKIKSNRKLLHENSAAEQFVTEVQAELKKPDSMFRQQLNHLKEFKRDNIASLNYLYTQKLVLD